MGAQHFQPGDSAVQETPHVSEAVPPQIDETAFSLLVPAEQPLAVQRHLAQVHASLLQGGQCARRRPA
jgi:hypothetical protein